MSVNISQPEHIKAKGIERTGYLGMEKAAICCLSSLMFLMAVCGIMTNIKRHLLPDAFTKLQFMEYFLM